jgi:hypothetical protein
LFLKYVHAFSEAFESMPGSYQNCLNEHERSDRRTASTQKKKFLFYIMCEVFVEGIAPLCWLLIAVELCFGVAGMVSTFRGQLQWLFETSRRRIETYTVRKKIVRCGFRAGDFRGSEISFTANFRAEVLGAPT